MGVFISSLDFGCINNVNVFEAAPASNWGPGFLLIFTERTRAPACSYLEKLPCGAFHEHRAALGSAKGVHLKGTLLCSEPIALASRARRAVLGLLPLGTQCGGDMLSVAGQFCSPKAKSPLEPLSPPETGAVVGTAKGMPGPGGALGALDTRLLGAALRHPRSQGQENQK